MIAPLLMWVVMLLAAPLLPGIATRTRALITGRSGAPVWQLYVDVLKLARRGAVYSTTTTAVFRLAPLVVLATAIIAALLVPLDGRAGVIHFAGDVVGFVSLLALGRFALVLGALDTGSSFEGMGASREVTFGALAEPGVFVGLAALAIPANGFSLSVMLGSGARELGAGVGPASLLVGLSLFALALAEGARVPVDDPTTHLELTMVHEVMVLDHSGPDLAMILYGNALKLSLFAALIGEAVFLRWSRGVAGAFVLLLGSVVTIGVAIGTVESVIARLRLPKVPLYIVGAGALGGFGLMLVLR